MGRQTRAPERVTEIVSLLRPERPRKWPESLTAAACLGDVERMCVFMERGADIEERSVGFVSPLAAACACGQVEAVRWLLSRGALLEPPGAVISPIQAALGKANCAVAALLLDAGLPVESAAWGAIAASSLGRLDALLWLVGRGLDLDKSYTGLGILRERALHSASKSGKREVERFLKGETDPGPPPEAPPVAAPFPKAAPHAAAEDRPRLLGEALDLIRGAGAAAAGWSACGPFAPTLRQQLISFAAGAGLDELVAGLLDAGGDPNVVPKGTPPPLTEAAGEAQVEVVRLLLRRGALPDGCDGKSWLPLASALESGEPEVVRVLLEAGANPGAKPAGGPKLAEFARGPFARELREILEAASRAGGAEGRKGRGGRARRGGGSAPQTPVGNAGPPG